MSSPLYDPWTIKMLRDEALYLEVKHGKLERALRIFIAEVNLKHGTHFILLKDDESPHDN